MPNLTLIPVDGEPRIRDLDLAARLGFSQPRDIRKLIKRNEAKLLTFGGCATVARLVEGNETTEYYLNQKQAIFLCMKSETDNAFEVQAEIVRVFDAHLNGEPTAPALNPANLSRLQLIEIAMQAEQERLALEHQVVEMQPKVAALDRIATASDGAMCLTDAAKTLQLRPIDLTRRMLALQWIYRRAGNKNLIAYQDKIQQGLLEHKIHVSRDETGVERVHEQVLVTPKGLAKLARIFQVQLPLDGEAA